MRRLTSSSAAGSAIADGKRSRATQEGRDASQLNLNSYKNKISSPDSADKFQWVSGRGHASKAKNSHIRLPSARLLSIARTRGQPIPPQEPRTVADSGGHFADFVISSGQVTAFLRCGSAAAAQAHHTLDSLLASGPREPIHVASGKRSVHWCYLYVITVQQDLAALPLICPAAKDEATNGLLLDAIFLADQTPIFFQAPLDQFVEEQNLLCQQRIKNLNPAAWDQAISLDITSVLFSRK